MKFTPKREEDLDRGFKLLPDGIYPFTVLESDEIPSKSEKNKGKLMYAVKLNVHGQNTDRHVYSYFAPWFNEWQLRHFAATIGKLQDYERGELNGSTGAFNGKVGYVKITTEKARGNFDAKNVVEDYIVREVAPVSEPPADTSDVPF